MLTALQPCPNEECRGECELKHEDLTDTPWGMMRNYWAECNAERGESCCGYRGPFAQSPEQAIALHNRMPRTEPWVSVAERIPEDDADCDVAHADGSTTEQVMHDEHGWAGSEFYTALSDKNQSPVTHWRTHTPPRGPVSR